MPFPPPVLCTSAGFTRAMSGLHQTVLERFPLGPPCRTCWIEWNTERWLGSRDASGQVTWAYSSMQWAENSGQVKNTLQGWCVMTNGHGGSRDVVEPPCDDDTPHP